PDRPRFRDFGRLLGHGRLLGYHRRRLPRFRRRASGWQRYFRRRRQRRRAHEPDGAWFAEHGHLFGHGGLLPPHGRRLSRLRQRLGHRQRRQRERLGYLRRRRQRRRTR